MFDEIRKAIQRGNDERERRNQQQRTLSWSEKQEAQKQRVEAAVALFLRILPTRIELYSREGKSSFDERLYSEGGGYVKYVGVLPAGYEYGLEQSDIAQFIDRLTKAAKQAGVSVTTRGWTTKSKVLVVSWRL